jgi:hypothetical protein
MSGFMSPATIQQGGFHLTPSTTLVLMYFGAATTFFIKAT